MTAESDDKAEEKPARKSASFWVNQLDYAAKREEKWRKLGDEIQCRYMDDRDHFQGGNQFEKRVNLLWSNTEVQKSALFSQLGNPDVRRAFPMPGQQNKIARTAALVIERSLVACGNRYDPNLEIEQAVEDQLLPGRGQCWIEYNPTVEDYEQKDDHGDTITGDDGQPQMASRVTYQDVRFCHVEWKSFRHGNGRSWDDIPWVARELLFTKSDVKERWGETVADAVPVNQIVDEQHINSEAKKDGSFKRARIWEIWYKPEQIRVYIAEGYPYELEREDDPYRLEGFFPCRRPLYAVKTASSLLPSPEFSQYKDQCDELDRVNTRLWKLLEKLKYCGVFDASAEDSEALKNIGTLDDGEFTPYKNFQALASAGGLAAAFQVRDLAPIAASIQSLAQRAVSLIQAIYEITGISDIMRGASDAAETATAQSIKAKFGSGRLQRKQREVARFVKGLYRMKAEIIAEHFERDQLVQMTGILLPTEVERQQAKMQLAQLQQQAQMAQQAAQGQQNGQPGPQAGNGQMPLPSPQMPPVPQPSPEQIKDLQNIADACSWEEISSILRSDDRRNYSIDIETDQTAFEDEQAEKQAATEFMGAMTIWLQQAIPAIQMTPTLAPLMKELTMMYVSKFKPGRSLEEAFEDAFEQAKDAPPQPNPEADVKKQEMALKQQEMQLRLQGFQQEQARAQSEQQNKAAQLASDGQQAQQDAQTKAAQMAAEQQLRQRELAIKEAELQIKATELHHKRQDAQVSQAQAGQDMALRQREADLKAQDLQHRQQEATAQRVMTQQKTDREHHFKVREMQQQGINPDGEPIPTQIEQLAQQLDKALTAIGDHQQQIAQGMQAAFGQLMQKEQGTQQAISDLAKQMTAPRL